MGNNVEFNNNGYVRLYSLKEMRNSVEFNNNGDVFLKSTYLFDISSINFTNNVKNVYLGNKTFWMKNFPYDFYPNIRGNFNIWNYKKDDWEIIK